MLRPPIIPNRPRPSQYHDHHPICKVFDTIDRVEAAFTGKGTDPQNNHFSFHRPSSSDPTPVSESFGTNLGQLGQIVGFNPVAVTLPNGAWPHSGTAIKAEDYSWVTDHASRTLVPVDGSNQPITYDAIATRIPGRVIAVQGADCPSIFLYDSYVGVIGLAHAGWKPLVRNVVGNVVDAMVDLGAKRQNIVAFISPGAGDRYNTFRWDDDMETSVQEVFIKAGRTDLLKDHTIRHQMTSEEREVLQNSLSRAVTETASLKLSSLAIRELETHGIAHTNISCDRSSTIVDQHSSPDRGRERIFKFHSFRRERPNHGLGMSVMCLK